MEVHAALARLSRNRLLALFTAVLAELSLIRVPAEAEADTAAVHGKIADAVLAGDASLARHRMSRHLRALAP
ncbi:FCD domain-containing protein [Actinomadura sp. 7K534]|uniref:FCD domain-containing protein n=1 Tax=Actinomadura sp. 7K534 TaxID=2530366 RepID=UPI0014047C1F|nr:FCD domain-containing protein [Actinomadura sp. 7K534]